MEATDANTRYKQELRGASLRATSGRMAVLRALEASPHATAETVFALISGDLPGTSPQAVYMVLNDLTRAGLIRRFEPAGSAALYERRIGDNHHHLVCDSCGRVTPFSDERLERAIHDLGDRVDYRVGAHDVVLRGTCPSCAKSASATG